MRPDVDHVYSSRDSLCGVDVSHEPKQVGVVGNSPNVRLEIACVDRVESDQCVEEAQVKPCELSTTQEALLSQVHLELIQCKKQLFHCQVVTILAACKPTSVHTIVHICIHQLFVQC